MDLMKCQSYLVVAEALKMDKERLAKASKENFEKSHPFGPQQAHSDGSSDDGNEAERHRLFIN